MLGAIASDRPSRFKCFASSWRAGEGRKKENKKTQRSPYLLTSMYLMYKMPREISGQKSNKFLKKEK